MGIRPRSLWVRAIEQANRELQYEAPVDMEAFAFFWLWRRSIASDY